MRIDKIEIDGFGKLNHFSLTLTEGFNLICGENESGKSTLCDFLLSMFYDMPNDGKRLELSQSFRRKYKPWQGERFGGRVYFTHEGKRFILEKSFGTTKRTDRARLLDAGTWEDCGSAENAGERFFGLGRDGFLKTLFIKGLAADAEGMDSTEILTRLSNQETSGDEDISYINIQNALEKEQHAILTKTGKGGKLYALREQKRQLEIERLSALRNLEATKDEEQKAETAKKQIATLTASLKETEGLYQTALAHERWISHKKTAETRAVLKERLAREKQKAATLKARLLAQTEQAQNEILQTELDSAKLLEKEMIILENKQEEAQKSKQTLLEDVRTKNGRNKKKAIIFAGIILAASIAFGFVFYKVVHPLITAGAGILASAAVVVFFWKSGGGGDALLSVDEALANISKELSEKRRQTDLLLKKYKAQDLNAFFARAAEERTSQELYKNQAEQEKATEAEIAALEQAIHELPKEDEEIAEQAVMEYQGAPATQLAARIRQQKDALDLATNQYHALSVSLAKQEGSGRTVPEIDSDLMTVSAQITHLEERYAALEKAHEWLSRAHGEIKQNYAPRLNQKIAEIFSRLTKDKYNGVKLGDGFHLNYKNENNEIVDAAHLSGGTYDLLYIALRFSSLSVLFDGKIPPVILDDALLQLDDERLCVAAEYLASSVFGQVIYFTCHDVGSKLFMHENITRIELLHSGGEKHELQN